MDTMQRRARRDACHQEGVCAGGIGCQVLFDADARRQLLGDGGLPHLFAASRTVFIPKFATADDQGQIVRSAGALRLLSLCNCQCEISDCSFFLRRRQHSISCNHRAQ